MYYYYVFLYIDDVLCISDEAIRNMKGIQDKLKLKSDRKEEPAMYVCEYLSDMTKINGQECLAVSYDKYCMAVVTNVEYVFGKSWFKVAAKVCYPYDLLVSSRYGCDGRAEGGWSPMVTRTHWDPEVGSVNW